jgi:hypothetical protein
VIFRSLPWFAGLLLVTLSACGGADRPRIDPRVAATVDVTKNEPPIGCEYIGAIKGSTALGDLTDAHADVIRTALLTGGNYVAVDIVERPMIVGVGGYAIRGRLFACRQRPIAPAEMARLDQGGAGAGADVRRAASAAKTSEEPAFPKALCDPDCSPGYACSHGACVTACNPACADGEQCSPDRTCRVVR